MLSVPANNTSTESSEIKYSPRGYRIENWDLYKPKKWYTVPEDELKLKQALEERENYLKRFKYHEDLPRLDVAGPLRGYEGFEQKIFTWAIVSYLLGPVTTKIFYDNRTNRERVRRVRIGIWAVLMCGSFIVSRSDAGLQPQNRDVFTPRHLEQKIQDELDLKLNLYQHVNRIKYEDKMPTKEEIAKVKHDREVRIRKAVEKVHGEMAIPLRAYSFDNIMAYPKE